MGSCRSSRAVRVSCYCTSDSFSYETRGTTSTSPEQLFARRKRVDARVAADTEPVCAILCPAGGNEPAAHGDQSAARQRDVPERQPGDGVGRFRGGVLAVRRSVQSPPGRPTGRCDQALERSSVRTHTELLVADRRALFTAGRRGRRSRPWATGSSAASWVCPETSSTRLARPSRYWPPFRCSRRCEPCTRAAWLRGTAPTPLLSQPVCGLPSWWSSPWR